MDDTAKKTDRYRETVFLPNTSFGMKAGLPQKEPELLKRWEAMGLYKRLRAESKGRPLFVLHDGPPYANGNIHIGHALNKILKDIITRSRQMAGFDSNYVPGWDCHGLPIEWKVEEEYRSKGKDKNAIPINDFRHECRSFARHWIDVQREEFKRLGVIGDWENPYLTMDFRAEALIARELMKFAESGQLYRGSKPVMWSVVEHTALAEAEVEYQDYTSDTITVKFPLRRWDKAHSAGIVQRLMELTQLIASETHPGREAEAESFGRDATLDGASVVIWTTTPWTIPGNRAVSYSHRIDYSLVLVTEAPEGNWAKAGDKLVLADRLVDEVMKQAKVTGYRVLRKVDAAELASMVCAHPLAALGYGFDVPLLDGDHVTDDAGTGFVHTAPSHGADDYNVWVHHQRDLEARGISIHIPTPVGANGVMTRDAPGFEGRVVITDKGDKGDANEAVIRALMEAGALIARARLKHQYPHSWRSKKPIIFRNTPQWFISMSAKGLRDVALKAIDETEFFPPSGQNRLRAMIEQRPDWVISRQRAWGVPITVFVNKETGDILNDDKVNARIVEAFSEAGADAWFADGAKERFLAGAVADPAQWEQVRDILDVWFDSGSTHAFVLEQRPDLKWPADVYLEGSDQHRGWFHSSLLESCGTRGRAPYDQVITHGFTMAEDGRKMSKSLGNQVLPQDVIKQSGADILRLWVASCDYADDQRIGPEILKNNVEAYRKLRNTMRYILGALDGLHDWETVYYKDMPDLERYILHRLHELDGQVRAAYEVYDYKRLFALLTHFMTADLSAFYFDIRKDALYCDAWSSLRRRACRTVLDQLFHCLTSWWAPILSFTMEEVWLSRFAGEGSSVHVMPFAKTPDEWAAPAVAERWEKIRSVRSVVTGALEIERQVKKTIGSALEAAPDVHVADADLRQALDGVDLAEICITSAATLIAGEGPAEAFRLDGVKGVAVVFKPAEGRKCARSWKITPEVGSDPDFPDVTPRDAEAVREWQTRFGKTV
jgi:isoleucyl-tRNA synthetase